MKVSMEVRNEAARFCVAVRAESIRRAVSIVEGRYPGRDIGVKFPVDPGGFFVEDPPPHSYRGIRDRATEEDGSMKREIRGAPLPEGSS